MMTEEKSARLAAIRQANAAQRPPADSLSAAPPTAAPMLAPAPVVPNAAAARDDFIDLPPAIAFSSLLILLLSGIVGAFAAILLLPDWLPGLSSSLRGNEPKAFWYLARSSAFVSYGLLGLSMAFGLLMTNKLARIWPGGPTAFDLHQHTSLLGLAFGIFHALILMGDHYIAATLKQVLTPFRYSGYAPFWVGLGQVGLYGMALIGLSFYVKPVLGRQAWRIIHVLSFVVFMLALVHGIMSGTDTGTRFGRTIYWVSGGVLLFLTLYRILALPQTRVSVKR